MCEAFLHITIHNSSIIIHADIYKSYLFKCLGISLSLLPPFVDTKQWSDVVDPLNESRASAKGNNSIILGYVQLGLVPANSIITLSYTITNKITFILLRYVQETNIETICSIHTRAVFKQLRDLVTDSLLLHPCIKRTKSTKTCRGLAKL